MKDQVEIAFVKIYNCRPDLIVRSPGRVNIIGEHTDYNDGFVMPAAIDKAAYFAISLRDDQEIYLCAKDLNETFSVKIDEIRPVDGISWPNYILGAVEQFKKLNIPVKGFNALVSSDIPIGAGLSSSAALECAVIYALNELLNTKLDKLSMAKMAQKTEHEFAGVMCGIMDMFASLMGRENHVIKLDCRTLEFEYVPFKLNGIKILLLNTNIKHSLASTEYNLRRKECIMAVEWIQKEQPQVNSLRDVTIDMLEKYVLLQSQVIYKRSRFIVQEIERLYQSCNYLKIGDFKALGENLYATHDGLSNMYEVSCRELDFLVDTARQHEAVLGSRMMGGGFGGCTINIVKEDKIDEIIESIKTAYEATMNLSLDYYVVDFGNGTSIV